MSSNDTPLIQCEDCGYMNPPEETFMFQGQVALCKNLDECIARRRGESDATTE